jgi:hypothetical protein
MTFWPPISVTAWAWLGSESEPLIEVSITSVGNKSFISIHPLELNSDSPVWLWSADGVHGARKRIPKALPFYPNLRRCCTAHAGRICPWLFPLNL